MRPLRYSINVTLDGCCDHREGIPDEELHRHAAESIARADALLFGRTTYEMMEAAWRLPLGPSMPAWTEPFAKTIDAAKKYVVSSKLKQVDWNAELLRGDLANAVRELKAMPGNGLFVGGVTLPLALAELGLIDEYEFIVHPRLVGRGPTLFAGLSKRVDLRLVRRLEFGSGAVAMRYEPRRPYDGSTRRNSGHYMSETVRQPIWLRGVIPEIPSSLQPVGHGLLNMLEEVEQAVAPLSPAQLWQSLGGAAPIGFHLRHLAGSTSRLFTYARGEQLSEQQRAALAAEKTPAPDVSAEELMRTLREVVEACLAALRHLDESQLEVRRAVGRAASASTVRGILHHAAEHAARHSGQVVTTSRIVARMSSTQLAE